MFIDKRKNGYSTLHQVAINKRLDYFRQRPYTFLKTGFMKNTLLPAN